MALIPGTTEYFRARKEAFALIKRLECQADETFHYDVLEAVGNPTVRTILAAQLRLDLLSPSFDETEEKVQEPTVEDGFGGLFLFEQKRRYYDAQIGIVTITVRQARDCEGFSYKEHRYLNGLLHDVDGPAVRIRNDHYIPEERHLDQDEAHNYAYGIKTGHSVDEDAIQGRMTEAEARYYGLDVD